MITPLVLAISLFLSVTWGVYLAYTAVDYRRARREGDPLAAPFRRVLVALSLWTICFAYVFRTACVLLGVGEEVVGQVTFFALVGTNVVASLWAVVTVAEELRDRR